MAYLTELEFLTFTGLEEVERFDYLLERASAELDALTRFYFVHNDLKDDFVGKQFKRALCFQIIFYMDRGTEMVEQLNNQPDSVRIGDTTVSYNRTILASQNKHRESMVSQDAVNMLKPTGLLYRGARGYGL